jgi:hypothetical protein
MKTKGNPEISNSRITFHIGLRTEKNVEWLLGFLNRLPRRISRKIDSITLAAHGVGFEWRQRPDISELTHTEETLAACLSEDLPDGFTGIAETPVTMNHARPDSGEDSKGNDLRMEKPL